MLKSTLYRSSLLRPHLSGLALWRASQQVAPTASRKFTSSGSDPQHKEPSPTGEPARDPSTPTDTPVVEGRATLDTPERNYSSSEPLPSPSGISDRPAASPEKLSDTAPPTDNQPSLVNVLNVEEVKERLRTWSESAAVTVRDRADRYTAVAATTFAQLGRELNKVTGYGEIESLKRQVVEQELRINATREAAREAKIAHEQAVQQRAQSQREVNDLLQRKSTWTDDDVGRFTALVRQDHLYEQAETRAKLRAEETEKEVDKEFTELMRVILNRYHEEQVWSDKIRSASTYGSLTVLGLNMAVFILAIIIVEPWKRKRLAQTFEKKVEELSGQTLAAFEATHADLTNKLKEQDGLLSQLVEVVSYSAHHLVETPVLEAEPDNGADHISTRYLFPDSVPVWTVAAGASVAAVVGWLIGSKLS